VIACDAIMVDYTVLLIQELSELAVAEIGDRLAPIDMYPFPWGNRIPI